MTMFLLAAHARTTNRRSHYFKTRLVRAIAGEIPGWRAMDRSIIYIDPFFSRIHQLVPHFCKHFRFEYQKEYRMLWIPPETDQTSFHKGPDHIYFDLGPLTDCAELIWL